MVPVAFAAVVLAVVAGVARRAADEAAGLRRDLRRFSDLRPALIELRHLSDDAARRAAGLRRPR